MKITQKVKITNRLGLHLRALAELVKTTGRFKCRILVKNGNSRLDAKSLINLLKLAASYRQELTLSFQGEDAGEAWRAVRDLFLNKLGEKEYS